ncbi:MAG TPA: FecR domain-containing protein [Flavisolibacter sp.]|nr:FecR domain-containing protein [Flavisolibacter sp.]
MLSDRFLQLITKQLSASLSTEEEKELDILLEEDNNRQAYFLLKKFWEKEHSTPDVERALTRVLQRISDENAQLPLQPTRVEPVNKRRFLIRASVALVALAFAITGYFYFTDKTKEGSGSLATSSGVHATANPVVEKYNAKGTRSIITLADGSKVWLNADSKLQYPTAFEGNTREVWLSGEAFFDVTKNKQRPFIIHLKKGTVKVLGTSFNIKAYDNASKVETSVSTGRVVFIPAQPLSGKKPDEVVLTKDHKAIYSPRNGNLETLATKSTLDKAWTEGKLIFERSAMADIAETLERNFGKPVLINDEELRTYHFSGSFENDRLEDILYYLSKTKPFTYRITESQVILSALR